MAVAQTGLTEVDSLIQTATHRGLMFPAGVTRWELIQWAAEALKLKIADPVAFERDGLREITRRLFPDVNP